MNWFKKWFLRPIYVTLNAISLFLMAAMLATILGCWYVGVSWGETYTIIRPFCTLYSLLFLGAYYLKWEYVYGPQKKQELKDGTT